MSNLVLIQVGYQKSVGKRSGQLVKAFLVYKSGLEEEVNWSTDPDHGKYLTDRSDIHSGMCWYLAKRFLGDGDQVRLEIFTGHRGKGEDTRLTQKRMYVLDPTSPVREFFIPHVGFRKFPVLKGRFLDVAAVSKRDEVERDLAEFVDDEEGM